MKDIGQEVAVAIIERFASKFAIWLWEKVIKKKLESGEEIGQGEKADTEPSEEQDPSDVRDRM